MIEIFDKRFVYFMWDDKLAKKRIFAADSIGYLMKSVEEGDESDLWEVEYSGSPSFPFQKIKGSCVIFAYYDPNYSIKKAFNDGKTIQYQLVGEVDWRDVGDEEMFKRYIEEGRTFRIKPEEYKWVVYLNRPKNGDCYLTAGRENYWKSIQRDFHAKTKLFVSSESEVEKWYIAKQKFTETIKGWEDGKTIQYLDESTKIWIDIPKDYDIAWFVDREYRVKPECPCEHSEEGKKEYRPYINSAEMIADFIDKFKVKCPPYAEPLIWVKGKESDNRFLVTVFTPKDGVCLGKEVLSFKHLFDWYTYLDGSPVGMEVLK